MVYEHCYLISTVDELYAFVQTVTLFIFTCKGMNSVMALTIKGLQSLISARRLFTFFAMTHSGLIQLIELKTIVQSQMSSI